MFAIRVPVAFGAGALVSVALFLGLWQLVSVPFTAQPLEEARVIQYGPTRVATPIEPRRPQKVEREPPKVVLVEPRGPRVVGEPITAIQRQPTQVARPPRTGLPIGVDRDVTPLVRVEPDYPRRAAQTGTQGWVHVRFTVTAAGTVRDATVVAADPEGMFEQAALEAVARWRYNPRVDGGIAVERVGLETIIKFKLDN